MKNLKVSAKLIVSFLIVILLTAIVGGAGFIGMMQLGQGADELYDRQFLPIIALSNAREVFQRNQVVMREVALARGSDERLNTHLASAVQNAAVFHSYMEEFGASIIDPEVRRQFDGAVSAFDEWQATLLYLVDLSRVAASSSEITPVVEERAVPVATYLMSTLDSIVNTRVEQAAAVDQEIDNTTTVMTTLIIVVVVAAVTIAMFLALYMSRLIAKPLGIVSGFMKAIADDGDIVISDEDQRLLDIYKSRKDEVGDLFSSAAGMSVYMNSTADELVRVSNGDLNFNVEISSDKDKLALTLQKTIDNLNVMFGEINTASRQVATGSKQIADGSQTLAQGSTEQAASVQQLSSSISQIAQKTKENADMAGRAA
ncbi:MAG: methyl-accepting chemotaxis protein, partial [Oscillospiraceae bacterium]|nr:methyl-accepting chemotaxis protein [Oscillospiraceae bacterium]